MTGPWLEGLAAAEAEDRAAVWTLDTLTGAARAAGIDVHRSPNPAESCWPRG